MSVHHLQEMGLDIERIATAVDFLDAYANSAAIAEREGPEASWVSTVDAASALREAAQWAMCFDPQRARLLLDRAGDLFMSVGQPFGGFLRVVSGSWFSQPPQVEFGMQVRSLERLSFPERRDPSEGRTNVPEPAALLHPQQQAYLMLAVTGSPPVANENRSAVWQLLTESPQRIGVAPVGALGTPIRRLWSIARHLFEASEDSAASVVDDVITMARTYAESMDLASTNDYLWRNAAAPVDVGDIDIMGVMIVATRRFGVGPVSNALSRRVEGVSFVARAPLEMAMEYVESES